MCDGSKTIYWAGYLKFRLGFFEIVNTCGMGGLRWPPIRHLRCGRIHLASSLVVLYTAPIWLDFVLWFYPTQR